MSARRFLQSALQKLKNIRKVSTSNSKKKDICPPDGHDNHHDDGGVIGANMPFQTENLLRFVILTLLFELSATSAQYSAFRMQLKKHSS